jgi:hypothetical protein
MDPMSPMAPIVWRNLISRRKASRRSLPQYLKSIAVFRTEVAESYGPRAGLASRVLFVSETARHRFPSASMNSPGRRAGAASLERIRRMI